MSYYMTKDYSPILEWTGTRALERKRDFPRKAKDLVVMQQVARRLRVLKQAVMGADASDAEFARFVGLTTNNWHNYKKPMPVALVPPSATYKICGATGATFDYIYRGVLEGCPFGLAQKIQVAERVVV